MSGKNTKLRLRIIETFGSQTDFSEALGIAESGVSRVVNGRRRLSTEQQQRWAGLLGCSTDIFKS